MRAMILAAGRGERMGELSKLNPKPLLRIGDRYLIEYSIASLVNAGITEIVINVSYLAEQIKSALGDGGRYGVQIIYSEEKERLETGGGILKALPLLGSEPFVVMSGDIITDYPIKQLPSKPNGLAHLVLVNNPDFHPDGDFGLQNGVIVRDSKPTFTFGNIALYHPDLFVDCKPGHFSVNQLLFAAMKHQLVTGELYGGTWHNVGTEAQLHALNKDMHVSDVVPVLDPVVL